MKEAICHLEYLFDKILVSANILFAIILMKHFIITKIQSKIPQKTKMECHKKPK